MNTTTLLLGVVVSAFGLGYFVYGRRQRAPIALACGIALMVVPYFISSNWVQAAVGVALAAIPWWIRI